MNKPILARRIIGPISILIILIMIIGVKWMRTPHLSPGINLKCEIPDTPDQLLKIVQVRETYSKQEPYRPYNFAQKFASFSGLTGSQGSDPRLYYYGLYNLTFYGIGMSHFEFNMPYKERYRVETLSESQCVEKADQLIEEISDYFNSSISYTVSSIEKVFFPDGSRICYYRINYDIGYDGVELLGVGTEAWVEVCDKGILAYFLHFPVIEERGVDKVYLTPIDALNRLESGSTVYGMKFGYHADFVHFESHSVVEYGYLINATFNGDFMEVFIPAMAGNVLKRSN